MVSTDKLVVELQDLAVLAHDLRRHADDLESELTRLRTTWSSVDKHGWEKRAALADERFTRARRELTTTYSRLRALANEVDRRAAMLLPQNSASGPTDPSAPVVGGPTTGPGASPPEQTPPAETPPAETPPPTGGTPPDAGTPSAEQPQTPVTGGASTIPETPQTTGQQGASEEEVQNLKAELEQLKQEHEALAGEVQDLQQQVHDNANGSADYATGAVGAGLTMGAMAAQPDGGAASEQTSPRAQDASDTRPAADAMTDRPVDAANAAPDTRPDQGAADLNGTGESRSAGAVASDPNGWAPIGTGALSDQPAPPGYASPEQWQQSQAELGTALSQAGLDGAQVNLVPANEQAFLARAESLGLSADQAHELWSANGTDATTQSTAETVSQPATYGFALTSDALTARLNELYPSGADGTGAPIGDSFLDQLLRALYPALAAWAERWTAITGHAHQLTLLMGPGRAAEKP